MELKKKIGRKEEETILPCSHPATDPLQTRTISSLCCAFVQHPGWLGSFSGDATHIVALERPGGALGDSAYTGLWQSFGGASFSL